MSTTAPTPDIQRQINDEADARFWAQTGYHPGQKLDPQVPADVAYVPVWVKIHDQLIADWKAGRLDLTHKAPAVAGLLGEAASAAASVIGHVAAAFGAATPQQAAQHMAAADDAHQRAGAASSAAAKHQPPSVSTKDVAQAATNAAAVVPITPPPQPGDAFIPALVARASRTMVDLLNVFRSPGHAAQIDGATPAPSAPTVATTPPTSSAPATATAAPDPAAAATVIDNAKANGPVTSKTPFIAAGLVAAGLGAAFAISNSGRKHKRRSAPRPRMIPA